jgi:hypothetical protein
VPELRPKNNCFDLTQLGRNDPKTFRHTPEKIIRGVKMLTIRGKIFLFIAVENRYEMLQF